MDGGGSRLERDVANAALHIVRDEVARVSRADFRPLLVTFIKHSLSNLGS